MEKISPFENKNKLEEQLVKLLKELKEKGAEDTEARNILDMWTNAQEALVLKENKPTSAIELNLKRARLYSQAGYFEEALENFESARMQAWNENRHDLYQAIMKEMDKLEENFDDENKSE